MCACECAMGSKVHCESLETPSMPTAIASGGPVGTSGSLAVEEKQRAEPALMSAK